ncbi:fimbrial protein [Acinetobacter larvae]|uniref:Fimbrial-type adhesion domain-containing protein n=1 Tax=Acinetobacter larvae TaxID=1789224 RepID=A0A1B2M392_9GAMM|nr:type 1 fimbrial protein [Acinetobacter larvae]AOA59493.1 hypothetical protein BFG52_14810 [Acinetobacter larvae]
MKKMNFKFLVAALGVMGIANVALATDGIISVNGKVVTATCTLTGSDGATGTEDVTVQLDTVRNDVFSAVNTTAGEKEFELKITNANGQACDDLTIGAIKGITLSGTEGTNFDATEKSWLINTDGTAPETKDVYVQILSGTTAIDFSSNKQLGTPVDGTYKLAARYISNKANPAPQTVKTSINYTLEYN